LYVTHCGSCPTLYSGTEYSEKSSRPLQPSTSFELPVEKQVMFLTFCSAEDKLLAPTVATLSGKKWAGYSLDRILDAWAKNVAKSSLSPEAELRFTILHLSRHTDRVTEMITACLRAQELYGAVSS